MGKADAMAPRRVAGRHHDWDPLVTIGCVLALAIGFVALWRLGVPLPAVVLGLSLVCLAACLLFMILEARSQRKVHMRFNRVQTAETKRSG